MAQFIKIYNDKPNEAAIKKVVDVLKNVEEENVTFGVYQGSWDGPTRALMGLRKDGHVAYISTAVIPTGEWIDFDTFVDNTWNLLEIEWRSIDKSAKFRS